MLIRNCDIEGKTCDVRIENGVIAAIEVHLTEAESEFVIDAKGGALLPGLHDHHIHLTAAAAAMNSVQCGPPHVYNEDDLRAALNGVTETVWVRGVGYYQSVAGDINRDWLDANGPGKPVRIQHRSGRLWILNSKAMHELGIKAPVDGRLYDRDDLVKSSMHAYAAADLSPIVERVDCSAGVTGVTDTTPGNKADDLLKAYRQSCGAVTFVRDGNSLHLTDVTGPDSSWRSRSCKVSLSRQQPSAAGESWLVKLRRAHEARAQCRRPLCDQCRDHAVSLQRLRKPALCPGIRIEHAAITDDATIDWIKRLGLTVVTQPNFVSQNAPRLIWIRSLMFRNRTITNSGV